jgi:tellurite resistance protein
MLTIDEHIKDLEKDTYIKALVAVAKIDGLLAEEKDFVNFQAGLIGVDTSVYWGEELEIDDIDFETVSNTTKKLILRDAIVIAYIDGEYSIDEIEMISVLANKMKQPKELVDEIESWLLDYWVVLKKGNELLGIVE